MNTRVEELRANETLAMDSPVSAISWPAIWAGAAVAAASSLLLMALGSGLGIASLSPWEGEGPSATTFSVLTAVGLIVVQWVASGLGGYITGRLRTRWVSLHTHEVAFRDTAHGFIMWSVATLMTVSLVAWAAASAIGGATRLAASAAGTAATAMLVNDDSREYTVDTLLRASSAPAADSNTRAEALRILARVVSEDEVSQADRSYLAQVIAARTSVSESEAQQRVDQAFEQTAAMAVKTREVADAARKSASGAAICSALAMLIGAFIAMVAAALGGRERDLHH